MKVRTLTLLLPLLTGCGGDGGGQGPTPVTTPVAPAATPTPTPAPTPTPTLDHSGTYSGSMLFNIRGGPEVPVQARVEVSQDGDELDLGELEVPGFGSFPLRTATMVNATDFVGSAGYVSGGCGRVKVSTEGSFNDKTMSLLAGLTSDCFHARFRGDLAK